MRLRLLDFTAKGAEVMTRQWRIGEINAELNRMLRDLSGCEWCCGGGNEKWHELHNELRDLEGDRVRVDLRNPKDSAWIVSWPLPSDL